jgi:hypothetical protein
MEDPKTELPSEPDPATDLGLDDIEALTVEMALAVVALIDRKNAKRSETRKKIVDATMKSLGKMAGEGLKEWAKANTFHAELLTPLSEAAGL